MRAYTPGIFWRWRRAVRASLFGSCPALSLLLSGAPAAAAVVNDVTQLNPIAVERVVAPRSADEVRDLVRSHPGPISIGGGRFSMGGQTAAPGALQLDMRAMNRVLAFSPAKRTITVEAGATWRQLQEAIDPHGLSIKIMQSYDNFTVGGSLGVNVHGRYVNQGPLIHSVRSIDVVLADGRLVTASPREHPEIFYGAIGGYGGLGVIVAATLELDPNEKLERSAELLKLADYHPWFESHIQGSPTAVFHNADIYPPAYSSVVAITYAKTDRDVTVRDRLRPPGGATWLDRLMYRVISDLPSGKTLRSRIIDPWRLRGRPVVWRNYEASYDVRELEPRSRVYSTYVLQEYFVPVARLEEFVPLMAEIFERYDLNVLNVSIRHAKADPGSYLAWAREECFAFVVYYKQLTTPAARTVVGIWTRELIDAVLSVGGAYYLPYQIHATDAQFHRAYPRARELFALKRKLDPTYKFRNTLWVRYFPPPAGADEDGLRTTLAARTGYRRPEDQTFLTLPEWYIVYSADEYADFVAQRLPSGFPYFRSIGQFWGIYARVLSTTRREYSFNWGYHAMIGVIGASFTAEYVIKGCYENTIGRLTEWLSLGNRPEQRGANDRFLTDVAGEYALFIHATPWYEFPFGTKLRELWARRDGAERWTLRGMERRMALTAELAAKAVWGTLMGLATGTAYAPEDLEVQAWVRSGGAEPDATFPGVRTLERLAGDSSLITVPRYERFTHAVPALVEKDVHFVEIAGNRVIMLTVIAPESWDRARLWGDVVHEWPLLTSPGRKRVALAVPVGDLDAVLPELAAEGVAIDHLYDY